MAIAALGLALFMLHRNMRALNKSEKTAVLLIMIFFAAGMKYYCDVINSHGWEYAIPGADMQAHFDGAQALSKGARWSEMGFIAARYEGVSLNTIGYFIYAELLSWLIFRPAIFSVEFNTYTVYVIQAVLTLDAFIRYARVFEHVMQKKVWLSSFLLFGFCVTYLVTASQLLRDGLLIWLMAVLLDYTIVYSNKEYRKSRAARVRHFLIIMALSVVCVLLRFYSIIVFLPIICLYYFENKMGLICSVAISGVLLFGSAVINIIKSFTLIIWNFSTVDFGELGQFLLFPSIFNQTKYLMNWEKYFANTNYLSGTNVPGVYYLMALWNIVLLPLILIGFFQDIRKKLSENMTWLLIWLNTGMLYSIAYNTIDTRHRLFMCLPMCFLAVKGLHWLRQQNVAYMILYLFTMTEFVLFLFML